MSRAIGWLWSASGNIWTGNAAIVAAKRILFLIRAITMLDSLRPFMNAPLESQLGCLLAHRPQTIGAVILPYQCNAWNAQTRLARILDHYAVISEMGGAFDFTVDDSFELPALDEFYKGLRVVINQPSWFMRDGQLTINLFVGIWMIYSLSFSFFHHDQQRAAFIGQIKGLNSDIALEEYRKLTKACYGMRPRDLLIEIFRMVCSASKVRYIFAVAEEYRQGLSRRPLATQHVSKSSSYNDIWEDRGGVRVDRAYYRLDQAVSRRSLDTVAGKKRGMYQRRYDMLDTIESRIFETIRPT